MTTTISYNYTIDGDVSEKDLIVQNSSVTFDNVTGVDLCKNEEMPDYKSYAEGSLN